MLGLMLDKLSVKGEKEIFHKYYMQKIPKTFCVQSFFGLKIP